MNGDEFGICRPVRLVLLLERFQEGGSQQPLALSRHAMQERYRALQAVEQERVCVFAAPENEKDAGFEGNRHDAERFLEVLGHLLLLVVPLERVARREHSVAVGLHFAGVGS